MRVACWCCGFTDAQSRLVDPLGAQTGDEFGFALYVREDNALVGTVTPGGSGLGSSQLAPTSQAVFGLGAHALTHSHMLPTIHPHCSTITYVFFFLPRRSALCTYPVGALAAWQNPQSCCTAWCLCPSSSNLNNCRLAAQGEATMTVGPRTCFASTMARRGTPGCVLQLWTVAWR